MAPPAAAPSTVATTAPAVDGPCAAASRGAAAISATATAATASFFIKDPFDAMSGGFSTGGPPRSNKRSRRLSKNGGSGLVLGDRTPISRRRLRFGNLRGRQLAGDRFAELCHGVAGLAGRQPSGREVEPHMRGDEIRGDAVAGDIKQPEAELRLGDAAIGRHAIPARRLAVILWHVDAPF